MTLAVTRSVTSSKRRGRSRTVFDIEPGWRPASPSPGIFRSVDTGLNPTELLFVHYAGKVAHHTGDKLTHSSVDEVILRGPW